MTALVPQKVDIEKAVADKAISFSDLMRLLAEREAEQAHAEEAEVSKPRPKGKALALTETSRVLLRTIPVELADLVLPAEPRKLKPEEQAKLVPLFENLKAATSALEKAEAAIKEAFHNHIDQDAPEGVEVDKNGHAISEGEIAPEGTDKKVVRGLVGGKPAGLTEADLVSLEATGDIDHKTYLELTVSVPAVRVLAPEEKIMAVLAKRPGLVKVLAKKARLTAKNTAIRLAKND